LKKKITSIADLKGRSVSPRQVESGAQALFDQLALQAGLNEADLTLTAPARTEADTALAVLEGKADAAFGLASIAAQYRLPFVPLIEERFDLLIYRRAWFEPPMQTFLQFCRSQIFQTRAREMTGYDIANLGAVHFNGA
jgi:molybdate-binding protein